MEVEHILRDFGLILGAGILSQLIATLVKLPEMVVLVAAGALIGPSVLGIVENPLNGVGAQLLFNIGVALILFHGGTGISLRVISRTSIGLGLLVLPGVLITAVIVALVVWPVFGVAFPVALLIGAVLAATDPAILIPLFDRLKLRPKVSQTVIAESAFNDVTATVLTLTLVGVAEAGSFTLSGPAWDFVRELVLGGVIGVVAGLVLCYAIASTARSGIWDESPGVAILAVAVLGYFSTEYLGGSAYLATFVMGLIVGNMDLLGLGRHDEHATLLEGFLGQVAEIATLLIFVTLGPEPPLRSPGQIPPRRPPRHVRIHLHRPPHNRPRVPPPRPPRRMDKRRNSLHQLVPRNRRDPRRRSEPAAGPRRRRSRNSRLPGSPGRLHHPPPASHHRRLPREETRNSEF